MPRLETERIGQLRLEVTIVVMCFALFQYGALLKAQGLGAMASATSASSGSAPAEEVDASSSHKASDALQGARHITLAQAQTEAAQANNPMARLGQLGVDAAKQHRLGAQADYFPKLGATFSNVHFNKFMGQELTVSRPIAGGTFTAGLPLTGKDQSLVALLATQPITPLFKIRQVVMLARADENIARVKAGLPVAETASAVETSYFALLIAQRQMALDEARSRKTPDKHLIASDSAVDGSLDRELEAGHTEGNFTESSSKVKDLTASLNALLGWPENTPLELEVPPPLTERISSQEAVRKSVAANPEVVEAEQNVAKARAGSKLSKLEYIPDVAIMGGYVYNSNTIPLLPRDFSFIGIMATYNLFDFGKREHSIKERNTQLEMAQTALALTRAKVAAAAKASYLELDRYRELSEVARRLELATSTVTVNHDMNNPSPQADRARIELDMLQLEFEHRRAYAKLRALMGEH